MTDTWPAVQALIDRAVAEGRHAPTSAHFCHGCRAFKPATHCVTDDGRELCRDCAAPLCPCPVCKEEMARRALATNNPVDEPGQPVVSSIAPTHSRTVRARHSTPDRGGDGRNGVSSVKGRVDG